MNALLGRQVHVLQMIAEGAPLDATLAELAGFIEAQEDGTACAILILAEDGRHFRRGCGPSLPAAYHDALDGAAAAPPFLGACGQSIAVSDIARDDRCGQQWRDLLLSCGFGSCLCAPVRGADGRILASLAVYHDRPRDPRPARPETIDIATQLASIALERQRETEDRRRAEDGLKKELDAVRQLQQISGLLILEEDVDALYRRIVDAAIMLMDSDAASVQMVDQSADALRLLAWKGFHPDSAAFWETVRPRGSGSSCGTAFGISQRVIVPDCEGCDFMAGTQDLEHFRRSGLRAMQSTPLLSRSGRLLGMISTHWRRPHQPEDSRLSRLDVLARQAADLIERTQSKAEIQRSAERLRQVVDGAREYAIITLDHHGVITSWNSGAERILGYSEKEAIGQHSRIFFTPEDVEAAHPAAEMAAADSTGRAENERWHMRKDGTRFWASGLMLPLHDGRQRGYVSIFRDLTDRRKADERTQLLINELNHRVKNTLATVQSIAMQTLSGPNTDEEARAALDARLQALARSHDILTEENWEGARLADVIGRAIEPFAAHRRAKGKFLIEGDDLRLSPKAALSLGMGIHELATNAAKYGALSVPDGKVVIRWRSERPDGRDVVRLVWHEREGPPVSPPGRKGFGSRLIEQALAYEMDGEVTLDYAPDGVRFEILLPRFKAGER